MVAFHAQYVVDVKGRRRAVQVPIKIKEFEHLIELLEDIEDIRYLKAHRHDKLIPMEKVHASLKHTRRV